MASKTGGTSGSGGTRRHALRPTHARGPQWATRPVAPKAKPKPQVEPARPKLGIDPAMPKPGVDGPRKLPGIELPGDRPIGGKGSRPLIDFATPAVPRSVPGPDLKSVGPSPLSHQQPEPRPVLPLPPGPASPGDFRSPATREFAKDFTAKAEYMAAAGGQTLHGWAGNIQAVGSRLAHHVSRPFAWAAGTEPIAKRGAGCSDWAESVKAIVNDDNNYSGLKRYGAKAEVVHLDSMMGIANHDVVRVKMPDGERLVLDPWQDPSNPVWREADYKAAKGPLYPDHGTKSEFLWKWLPGVARPEVND